MIQSIIMRNCATYDETGVSIENCKKVNFFYGSNGSGKSTISNFLQNKENTLYSKCEIEWENDIPLEVVVYNREFREKNFKENIAGVFTLGEDNVEAIAELEKLKELLKGQKDDYSKRKKTLNDKKEEKNRVVEEMKNVVWDEIFKVYDYKYKEAFSGVRSSKEKFLQTLLEKYEVFNDEDPCETDIEQKAKELFTDKREKCEVFPFEINSIISEIEMIEQDDIWGKVISGNKDLPISELIEFLHNSDWVRKGREYIQENDYCPFCQEKTVTTALKKQFEDFFSGEYEKAVENIKCAVKRYEELYEKCLREWYNISVKAKSISVGQLNLEEFKLHISKLENVVQSNQRDMKLKEKELGHMIVLQNSIYVLGDLKQIIDVANVNITRYNQMIDNYAVEKNKLIDEVWKLVLARNTLRLKSYVKKQEDYKKAIQGIKDGISKGELKITTLENQIEEIGKRITSIQPTVDEINKSLIAYGFTNFKIVPAEKSENAYQVCREDGTLATNTLSEGEETFITFLYFMQLAKGANKAEDVTKQRVLILDDPICSLDSTVLYIVSSIVKELLQKIRKNNTNVVQIFILTHNVFFHKEASFIDTRTKDVKDVHYWILNKDKNVSYIKPYESNNPIKTSYELLWNELKTKPDASQIHIQNIMRRIIENYFSLIGNKNNDDIVESFKTPQEQMICHSLISWINDGSHSIYDDLHIDSYMDSTERYKETFKAIFVNMGHEAHYEMMMAE